MAEEPLHIPVNPPLPPESGGPHPDDHPDHPDLVEDNSEGGSDGTST